MNPDSDKAGEYHETPLEDHLVVVRQGVDRLFVLNHTAQIIWEEVKSAHASSPGDKDSMAERCAARLTQVFGVDMDQARRDVGAALAQWRNEGLIGQLGANMEQRPPDLETLRPVSGSMRSLRHYRMLGVPFAISYASDILEEAIHPRFAGLETGEDENAPLLKVEEAVGGGYGLFLEDGVMGWGAQPWNVEPLVHAWVVGVVYPDRKWLISLHAAAVGDGNSVIVFPAFFGGGKSTLTMALAHEGFRYFSDDIVPLTFDLRAAPFPVDIGLKEGSWEVAARYDEATRSLIRYTRADGVRFIYTPPPAKALPSSPQLMPVRRIVFPRYIPGAPALLAPLEPLETLIRLTHSESKIRPEPERVARFIEWIKSTPAFALEYGDLEEVCGVIRKLFRG
ncbi:MAG: PqqD family protein [Nitrospinota bacterium]|nr:PqqD family protein [Nitrospinota bacterium]